MPGSPMVNLDNQVRNSDKVLVFITVHKLNQLLDDGRISDQCYLSFYGAARNLLELATYYPF